MASTANLEACLPAEFRGPTTTITRIAAGLSGAGVYRVEAAGQALVLKVSGDDEPLAAWRIRVGLQRLAADAGLAPRIVHVDEDRRAMVSAFVVDRSFLARYWDPRSHQAAVEQLGGTLRRLHDLPLPPEAEARDARAFLAALWSQVSGSALPPFVGDAAQRMLAEPPAACERAAVLSHNDVNPTNLVYDGEHLMLLDWDMVGPNDPYFDLAAIAVFLRMDDATCLRLLAAHDGAPVPALPARFAYDRRMVAVMCGLMFLRLARSAGHPGATGETLDSTPPLGEIYQRLRAGELSPAAADGQWWIGLALVKTSLAL